MHESCKVAKGQGTIINQINSKNHNVFASRNWILPNRTMLMSVYFIPLHGFPRYWNYKTSRAASARESLTALKGRRRLRYFSRIDRLPSVLGLVFRGNTYDWQGARHWYLWLSSELFFTRHLPEFIGNMQTPTTTRAFVGYLSFFRGKVRVSRFTQKRFGSKNVLKPTLDMKQQVFPRNKLKNNNNNNKKQFTQWINGWNRINSYRILA